MKKIAEAPRAHKDLKVKTYNKDLNNKLDRIERMLKWLVVQVQMDWDRANLSFDVNQEYTTAILDNLFNRYKLLPDISDILEEKK